MVVNRKLLTALLASTLLASSSALADNTVSPPPPPPPATGSAPAGNNAAPGANTATTSGTPAATGGTAATPNAGAPANAQDNSPKTSDEAFDVRVKGMEEQVNDIKEKIFRTKARLLLLQETVVGGDIISGARAIIVHKNEMGATFALESAAYALDGSPIFTKVDVKGDLADKDQIEIFNGRIVPGNHQLAVKLEFKGHGIGPITYLDGYRFKVTSNYTFNAEAGKVTTVQSIGYEKGGPFAELKDKPDVRYETNVSKDASLAKGSTPTPDASTPSAPPSGANAP